MDSSVCRAALLSLAGIERGDLSAGSSAHQCAASRRGDHRIDQTATNVVLAENSFDGDFTRRKDTRLSESSSDYFQQSGVGFRAGRIKTGVVKTPKLRVLRASKARVKSDGTLLGVGAVRLPFRKWVTAVTVLHNQVIPAIHTP